MRDFSATMTLRGSQLNSDSILNLFPYVYMRFIIPQTVLMFFPLIFGSYVTKSFIRSVALRWRCYGNSDLVTGARGGTPPLSAITAAPGEVSYIQIVY